MITQISIDQPDNLENWERDEEVSGATDAYHGSPIKPQPGIAYLRGYCSGLQAVIWEQQKLIDEFSTSSSASPDDPF